MNNGALSRLFASTIILLDACSGGIKQPFEQTSDVSYVVDSSVNFSVTSRDGTIRIYGSDLPELRVHTVKKAYSSARLEKIVHKIVAATDSISITTEFPPGPKWSWEDRSGTVDYTIILPQAATITRVELDHGEMLIEGIREGALHARLGSGLMFVRNCFSDMQVDVTAGNLTLSYDWWEQIPFTAAATVHKGNIWSFIPGDAAFHLVAQSPSGRISNDFSEKEERRPGPLRKIDMIVQAGDRTSLSIRAENGNIRIAETNP